MGREAAGMNSGVGVKLLKWVFQDEEKLAQAPGEWGRETGSASLAKKKQECEKLQRHTHKKKSTKKQEKNQTLKSWRNLYRGNPGVRPRHSQEGKGLVCYAEVISSQV